MVLSLSREDLQYYISHQLEYRFPDRKTKLDFSDKKNAMALADGLERTEYCFSHIHQNGYRTNVREGQTYFNHLHMDQYSLFLYYFSNSLYKREGNTDLCSKLVLLNRDLSGCWFSYKANLPDIFILIHPVGTVIGHRNVEFSNYLVILQNVTINATDKKLTLGKGLFIGAGAKIIGNGDIGSFCSIGANTLVRNPNLPDNYLIYQDVRTGVVTQTANPKESCFAARYFYEVKES